MSRRVLYSFAGLSLLLLQGCIRAQNYHPNGKPSTFYYRYDAQSKVYGQGYFKDISAHEAYLEFNARGAMYRDKDNEPYQLNAALDLIHSLRYPDKSTTPHKIALYVFIHGWKNNASESSGNVWGFRRFLSDIASQHCDIPVIGLYIGWPGASVRNDKFLTFWDREPVADNVGQGELLRANPDKRGKPDEDAKQTEAIGAMERILQAVKGPEYNDDDKSIAVVIGHSFGGIVLEHVATALLEKQLGKSEKDKEIPSPADLFVLLNEAGAAAIGRPFLMDLADKGVTYIDPETQRPHPLLLSMTSTGDIATKLAYPGGEYFSFKRSPPESYADKTSPVDRFGQEDSLPYDLLTAANMIALQSHQIVPYLSNAACDLPIYRGSNMTPWYCMNAIRQNRLNTTPYWIMQMPQVFVPDHSSVFQDYLLQLISAVIGDSGLAKCPTAPRLAPPPPQPGRAQPPPPPAPGRPRLQRSK